HRGQVCQGLLRIGNDDLFNVCSLVRLAHDGSAGTRLARLFQVVVTIKVRTCQSQKQIAIGQAAGISRQCGTTPPGQGQTCPLPVIKGNGSVSKLLTDFVPFAANQHDILFISLPECRENGTRSAEFDLGLTLHACPDLINNVLRVLVTGVVTGQYDALRQALSDLPHHGTFLVVPATATTNDAMQLSAAR